MASSVFLQLADGCCVWKSKGCSEVFFCNKVVGLLLASSMSLSIVAVPVYIFVCFINASKLHVYSGVGPAIEVIKWHEKPEAMEPMESTILAGRRNWLGTTGCSQVWSVIPGSQKDVSGVA